jgi:hypothetical protein
LSFHFVPQRGPLEAVLDDIVERPAGLQPVHLHAIGDVLEDRLGKRVGALKHHAHAAAQLGNVHIQHVLAVQQHLSFIARVLDGLVDAVQRAKECGLSAAGGANERGDPLLGNFQADVVQRVEIAVEKVQVDGLQFGPRGHLGLNAGGRRGGR